MINVNLFNFTEKLYLLQHPYNQYQVAYLLWTRRADKRMVVKKDRDYKMQLARVSYVVTSVTSTSELVIISLGSVFIFV